MKSNSLPSLLSLVSSPTTRNLSLQQSWNHLKTCFRNPLGNILKSNLMNSGRYQGLGSKMFQGRQFFTCRKSESWAKSPEFNHENPLKTQNIGFFSTNSVEGTCVSVNVNIDDNTVMGRLLVLHLVFILKTLPLPKRLLTSFTSSPVLLPFLELASPLLHLVLVTIGKCYLWISIIVANVQECILATVTVCLTLTAWSCRNTWLNFNHLLS